MFLSPAWSKMKRNPKCPFQKKHSREKPGMRLHAKEERTKRKRERRVQGKVVAEMNRKQRKGGAKGEDLRRMYRKVVAKINRKERKGVAKGKDPKTKLSLQDRAA